MSPVVKSILRKRQGELGQFFTPSPIADFMAAFLARLPRNIRFLDAGAGAGALTEAFVRRVCRKANGVQAIDATVFEIDALMLGSLSFTMRRCHQLCAKSGIDFSFTIHGTDFIEEVSKSFCGLFSTALPGFDVAITNPPYRKIGVGSPERAALHRIGIETGNLYAGFIALIHRLLKPGGQLVGITPRSFCNGPYFRSFREDFLNQMELHSLHVFESRAAAFRDDDVLQENIIFHAVKGQSQPRSVMISSSSGEHGSDIKKAMFPFEEIVHTTDPAKFIHIPVADDQIAAKTSLAGLHTTLASLDISVSTGRVVDFRLKESLRANPEDNSVPLIYPCHFNGMKVRWPNLVARKPNAIDDNDLTRDWLVPTGIYVLTKRFTAKEERRRLVACLLDPREIPAERLGFENHLNYFHSHGHGLDRALAMGLIAFLNSSVVDQYFRRFSGHTQVNATDLRTLAYPDLATLQAMGAEMESLSFSQEVVDQLVQRHIHAVR